MLLVRCAQSRIDQALFFNSSRKSRLSRTSRVIAMIRCGSSKCWVAKLALHTLGLHQGLASSQRPRDGLQFDGKRHAYVLEVLCEALMLRKHLLHEHFALPARSMSLHFGAYALNGSQSIQWLSFGRLGPSMD